MAPRGRVGGRAGWAGLFGLVLGAVLVAGGGDHEAASAQPARPNIVLIETDDQTVESLRVMTNVGRLLTAQGTTFDNSIASYSLCCPSRATILTGQYAHNHGVLGNQAPEGGYYKLDSTNTLPVWLQRAGYYTAHIGKYLNGYGTRDPKEIPPGWSEWHGSVDPSTYRFYGYMLNEGGTLRTYGSDPASYQADVYRDKALELIRRRTPAAQPFFLWLAFLAPHSGGPREPGDPARQATPVPAPRHRDRFAAEPLPSPPSLNEADVSDKPELIRRRPLLTPQRLAAIRENYQQRLESLLAVDEAVGQVVAELERLGELERTLIIFTADNGFFHGEHRVPSGKVLLYEPSIRVPLIVRGLGFPAGRHLNEPVANIDVAPTVLELARATSGRRMDGRSLVPILRDPGLAWGRELLVERGPGNDNFTAIRTPRFVYAEHANGERELYDLARDPHQLDSRHGDPAYAQMRSELAARLLRLRGCAGDGCRRGPALRTVVRYRAGRPGCVGSNINVRVGGGDARLLARVDVSLGGSRRASDTAAPFTVVLPRKSLSSRRLVRLRTRSFLGDGRIVTADRWLRACRRD
jgi:N-acetylglucosamine-6-sulfatase